MRPLSDLPIRLKLLGASMFASSVALLVASVVFVLYDVYAYREALVRRLTTNAQIVGYNCVSPLMFNDERAARATLSSMQAEPQVIAAAVYATDGRVFTTYVRGGGRFEPPPLPVAGGSGHAFRDGRLLVFHPIVFDGSFLGTVLIQSDLSGIGARLRRYAGIVALVFLASVLVALAISSVFQKTISAPILRLAETARVVSTVKDYAVRAKEEGRDELGLLMRTFNEMLAQIQARDGELSEARAGLEQRVEERTRALQAELVERRRAEEALRKSQLLLAEAQAIAHVGSWEWDVGEDAVRWSDEMYRVYGLDAGTFTATYEGFLDHVHPDDRELVSRTIARSREDGRPFSFDHRIVRPDGSIRTLHAYGSVVRDRESGRTIRVLGTGQDVTERKAAEDERAELMLAQVARQEAEASRRRSAYLAEVSAALARTFDYDAILATVARLAVPEVADWCAVYARAGDDVLRPVSVEHVNPARAKAASDLALRFPPASWARGGLIGVMRRGVGTTHAEPPPDVRDAPGGRELLENVGFTAALLLPLRGRGESLGVVCLVMGRDRAFGSAETSLAQGIVDRAGMALDNARLYREAQEANRLKDEFLATLSHELRTPLNAIVGWTHLLRSGELDEEREGRALETIERNVKAQTKLIEDILDVSRIVAGKLRLNVQEVEVGPIVDAALDSVRPAAEAKEIRLQRVLGGGGSVVGDPDRLQQVVWNLVSNAVKFTPRGGRVRVRLCRANSHVDIVVQDTGAGIKPEFLPHVFERFRQADASSTRPHGGLGLGLAIARHLVELHGGTVEVASEGEGRGATFTVRLPVVPVADRRLSPPSGRGEDQVLVEAAPRLSGLRVLVVDDEADSRDLIAMVLEGLGARPVTAASTEEALSLFRGAPPDVLLSDIEMPGDDGYALIRRVRALAPEEGGLVPAAALTAYARSEDRLAALMAGFHMHLAKPVQPAELAAVLMSLAGRRPRAPS